MQNVLIPSYAKYQEEGDFPATFYAPELLSSSFIVRNQHVFYNQERKNAGYPELYYKLAANNPRNPVNKADALEKHLIEMFNEHRDIKSYREIIEIDGKKMLYVAIPFLENDARCMRCHGKREDAPPDLQQRYPGQGGFNETIGEIRAITSIRAPVEHEYASIYGICFTIFAGFLAFGGLFFFNTRLRALVHTKTTSLKEEIEERKKTEEDLKIKESAIAASINAIALIDLNGMLTYVNQSFLALWGYDNEQEVIGKPAVDFWRSEDEARNVLENLRHTNRWLGEMQARKKDREIFFAQSSFAMVSNKEGLPLCIMASFLDVTEKHKFEDQIRQSQRLEAMGTLAGGIAHDFSNILTPILGYADIVQSTLPEGSEVWNNQQAVLDAGYRARDLVQQILAFARQAEHERHPIQIRLIVKEVIKLLRASIPTTIDIKHDIEASSSIVLADPTQIHQIVMNLCTNAYQAMEKTGGTLGISLIAVEVGKGDDKVCGFDLSPGHYLRLEVSDTGGGMDKKTMARIFEPYFTTKERGKGTGLGLALVHGIVKSCGGHITVYSEPGKGTTFHVYLPRVLSKATAPDLDGKEALPTGKERILVVDDEEAIVQMERHILEGLGYKVTVSSSSTEALDLLLNQPSQFDLVITDMTMPNLTGAELAQQYLSIKPDALIILYTGFSELINEEKAKAIGICDYIMKPVIKKTLAKAVRNALDTHKN